MIAKPRTYPVTISKLEAMMRRISSHHTKRTQIEADVAKRKAGYKGEVALDYHLSFLPKKEYTILHDLRLKSGEYFFQIDTLILTPTYILLVEVKNLFGTLTFEPEFQQLIRQTADAEDIFPDPITQVKHQAKQLRTFLAQHNYPEVPIETLVVVANSSSRITFSESARHIRTFITRDTNLTNRIEHFTKTHRTPLLCQKTIRKLTRLLTKKHTPASFDPFDYYQLTESDLIKGVHCPSCHAIPMTRLHGKWVCSHCYYRSRSAHLESLIDYAHLIQTMITNKATRHFLQIDKDLARRILKNLHVDNKGYGKRTTYELDVDQLAEMIQKLDER
ncbi:nuclease-related domain-containing protein [Bacillus sp. FJAT-45037]|uniref:nuclease-related domain-containing protein n=1 Tax=Bacillus sp. FJAT-45037 TaxID=2011007 RepID=UPI000C246ECB|nr:nuclease-related domain-containing protein [Bacillus sp. FJAT-45037]